MCDSLHDTFESIISDAQAVIAINPGIYTLYDLSSIIILIFASC